MTQNANDPAPRQPTPPEPAPAPSPAGPGVGGWFTGLPQTIKLGLIVFACAQVLLWLVFVRYYVQPGQAVAATWQGLVLGTLSLLTVVAILLPTFRNVRREEIAYGLLAASLLYLWVPFWVHFGTTEGIGGLWPIFLWAVLNVALLVGAGLWLLIGEPPGFSREFEVTSLGVILVLGGVGATTAVLGMVVPVGIDAFQEVFTSGLSTWREHWREVVFCLVAIFGSLALMFVGLQFGRSLERASAGMRRLVYGFNAILTGMLLCTVLAVLNLLTYVPSRAIDMGAQVDWSASKLHSIAPATENFLKELDKPVKVYVFLDTRDVLREDCERLLQTFHSHNPAVNYEAYSPYTRSRDVEELMTKYQITDAEGMLVVYGPETSQVSHFIPRRDLFAITDRQRDEEETKGRAEQKYTFKGEPALKSAISYLADDKRKPVVYFAQVNGVPQITPSFGMQPTSGPSYSSLRERLARQHYEVKPLDLGSRAPDRVPEDAELVVVAGLRFQISAKGVKALTDYMNPTEPSRKKGKMIVLLDVYTQDNELLNTGIEPLLKQFQVSCTDDRLINPNPSSTQPVTQIRSIPVIFQLRDGVAVHPVAKAFASRENRVTFPMDPVRPVEPIDGGAAAGGRYSAFPVLCSNPNQVVWKTGRMGDPVKVRADLMKLPADDERRADVSPVVTAVAVSEPAFNMPGHPPVGGRQDAPRLVVFGSSTWVSDAEAEKATARTNGDLFASCVSWLRGKSDLGVQADDTPGKDIKEFTLADADNATVSRLRWLPLGLLLLGMAGVGGGIWAMRRR